MRIRTSELFSSQHAWNKTIKRDQCLCYIKLLGDSETWICSSICSFVTAAVTIGSLSRRSCVAAMEIIYIYTYIYIYIISTVKEECHTGFLTIIKPIHESWQDQAWSNSLIALITTPFLRRWLQRHTHATLCVCITSMAWRSGPILQSRSIQKIKKNEMYIVYRTNLLYKKVKQTRIHLSFMYVFKKHVSDIKISETCVCSQDL